MPRDKTPRDTPSTAPLFDHERPTLAPLIDLAGFARAHGRPREAASAPAAASIAEALEGAIAATAMEMDPTEPPPADDLVGRLAHAMSQSEAAADFETALRAAESILSLDRTHAAANACARRCQLALDGDPSRS